MKNLIPLWAVIQLCDQAPCNVDDELWSWYGKTSRKPIPLEVIQEVNGVKVNGRTPTLIAAPVTGFDGIKVVSAFYDSVDVTSRAASFLDTKGIEDYKITARFLGMPSLSPTASFELKWKCSKDPQTIVVKKIQPPIEGQKIRIDCEKP
jgi:hypothetical protein